MGKRKYDEAEPLLISGYEGMRERQRSLRDPTRVLTESLQILVQFFEATSQSEKTAEWKTKLATVQSVGPRGRPVWPQFYSDDQATAER